MEINSDIAYYYCNENVFNSIIEKGKVWLTSIWDLNDSLEVYWTFNKIWPIIKKNLQKNFTDKLDLIALIDNEVNNKVYTVYRHYIMCFSKEKDLLSQWRGYADDGKGYSIGFNFGKLGFQNDIPWSSTDFYRSIGYKDVIYDLRLQLSGLYEVLKQVVQMDYQQAPIISAIMNLSSYALIFKNPYFHEENEVRLMLSMIGGNLETPDSNGKISGPFEHDNHLGKTTHYELDLSKCNPNGCIEEIILGPKNSQSILDIYKKLKSNGYDTKNITVSKSLGSYR